MGDIGAVWVFLVTAATVGGILGGALSLAAAGSVRHFFGRPRLRIDFETARAARVAGPYGELDPATGLHDTQAVTIRCRVRNVGRDTARDVSCMVREVIRCTDERARLYDDETIDLRWSHMTASPSRDLAPGEARYVDVCFITEADETGGVRLASEHVPASLAGLLAAPGRFHLKLAAVSANARAAQKSVSVDWNGRWYDLVPWRPREGAFQIWRRTPWARDRLLALRG